MVKKAKIKRVGHLHAAIRKIVFYLAIIVLAASIVGITIFLSDWLIYNIPVLGPWVMPLIIGIVIFVVVNLYWQKTKQVAEAYEVEKKAYQELRHLTETKDEFILATQHHLRTPLSIIKGYLAVLAELLNKKEIDKTLARDYLSKAAASTERLTRLLNELLDITQLKIGSDALELRVINPRNIITEIAAELQAEIEKKKLRLEIVPQTGWPKLRLDEGKIKMALSNLIDNAIKYTQTGGIMITGQKKNNFFRIIIKDTGMGIEPAEIRTIFEKYFERGQGAKKINVTGRGIGLYIAGNVIREHQGRVYARSAGSGKGSEFIVELPL